MGNHTRDDGSKIKEHGHYAVVTFTFYDQGGSPLTGVKVNENVVRDVAQPDDLFKDAEHTQSREMASSNKSGQVYDVVGVLGDKRSTKRLDSTAYTVSTTQTLKVSYGGKTFQIVNTQSMSGDGKKNHSITVQPKPTK